MVIVNESKYILTINGKKLDIAQKMNVEEKTFNTQTVFSDVGRVEIVTEYSKRKFRWFGYIFAYEHKELKDSDGLPYIIITEDDLPFGERVDI